VRVGGGVGGGFCLFVAGGFFAFVTFFLFSLFLVRSGVGGGVERDTFTGELLGTPHGPLFFRTG